MTAVAVIAGIGWLATVGLFLTFLDRERDKHAQVVDRLLERIQRPERPPTNDQALMAPVAPDDEGWKVGMVLGDHEAPDG